MPRLDLIPIEQRRNEGALLREKWEIYKRAHGGITQDRFCADHAINQGQLQRWFSGARQIPSHRLAQLAKIMDFDASEIRPSAQQTAEDWSAATNSPIRELESRWRRLTPSQVEEALRLLDLIERAGDPSKKSENP